MSSLRPLLGLFVVVVVFLLTGVGCIPGGNAPTLLSPPDGDTIAAAEIIFSWSAVDGAAYYRLEIARDSGFASPLVSEGEISAISYTLDNSGAISPLTGEGTYFWQVTAYSEDAGWGPGSDAWSFYYVKPGPPPSAK